MKKEVKGTTANDLSNLFIWSGWKYYLTKPHDCYILFSPIKYWKSCELGNKKFIDGYLFNREHFHASPSAISCILWKNEEENREGIALKTLDIALLTGDMYNYLKTEELASITGQEEVKIKKIHNVFSDVYYDKRKFDGDCKGVYCGRNGMETNVRLQGLTPIFNENMVGYLRANGAAVEPLSVVLTRAGLYNGHGFYLRRDNFIDKLPLFCAKLYPQNNWYERDIYFTTADGGGRYAQDREFLKSCLIFTCLSQRNHCLSFNGSDGRFYRNELCFDKDTLAGVHLQNYTLAQNETELLAAFDDVLKFAKGTAEYNGSLAYGTYQIDKELNTRRKNDYDTIIYDYPELNTALNALKTKLTKYYGEAIQPKLFEYELLK